MESGIILAIVLFVIAGFIAISIFIKQKIDSTRDSKEIKADSTLNTKKILEEIKKIEPSIKKILGLNETPSPEAIKKSAEYLKLLEEMNEMRKTNENLVAEKYLMSVNRYFYEGNAYVYSGEYDRAIESYDEAIKMMPGYPMVYNNRAIAYTQKDEFDKALTDCNKVLELNPDDVKVIELKKLILKQKELHKETKEVKEIEKEILKQKEVLKKELKELKEIEKELKEIGKIKELPKELQKRIEKKLKEIGKIKESSKEIQKRIEELSKTAAP